MVSKGQIECDVIGEVGAGMQSCGMARECDAAAQARPEGV